MNLEIENLVLMNGQDKDQARDNINHLFDTHVNFEKFLHRHLTDEEEIIVSKTRRNIGPQKRLRVAVVVAE
mgnify:CR=1 FL=1